MASSNSDTASILAANSNFNQNYDLSPWVIIKESVKASMASLITFGLFLIWFVALTIVVFHSDAACPETLHGWALFSFWIYIVLIVFLGVVVGSLLLTPTETFIQAKGLPTWYSVLYILFMILGIGAFLIQLVWGIIAMMKYEGIGSCRGLLWIDILWFVLAILSCVGGFISMCMTKKNLPGSLPI